MKKAFKYYAVVWAILLAVFNVLCFVTPNEYAGYTKFGGAFWSAYIFITLAFVGQLVCAYLAFKAENLQKLFYNMPLITISYAGLVIMLVVGGAAMLIPDLPNWVGVIACFIVLAFTAVAVVKASAAAEAVQTVDKKVQDNTEFIRNLTAEAEQLVRMAPNEEIRKECKKVYEAIRYSDPVSNEKVADIESAIAEELKSVEKVSNREDIDLVHTGVNKLLFLIRNRNDQCKRMKRNE